MVEARYRDLSPDDETTKAAAKCNLEGAEAGDADDIGARALRNAWTMPMPSA